MCKTLSFLEVCHTSKLARCAAAAKLLVLVRLVFSFSCIFLVFFTDFKECLNTVYSAIEEADFLAIDGEFSGKCKSFNN